MQVLETHLRLFDFDAAGIALSEVWVSPRSSFGRSGRIMFGAVFIRGERMLRVGVSEGFSWW